MTQNQREFAKYQEILERWIKAGEKQGLSFSDFDYNILETPRRIYKKDIAEIKALTKTPRWQFFENYAKESYLLDSVTKGYRQYVRPESEAKLARERAQKAVITKLRNQGADEDTIEFKIESQQVDNYKQDKREDFYSPVYTEYDDRNAFEVAYHYGENLISELQDYNDTNEPIAFALRDVIMDFVNNADDTMAQRFSENYESKKGEIIECLKSAIYDSGSQNLEISKPYLNAVKALDMVFEGTGYDWTSGYGQVLRDKAQETAIAQKDTHIYGSYRRNSR